MAPTEAAAVSPYEEIQKLVIVEVDYLLFDFHSVVLCLMEALLPSNQYSVDVLKTYIFNTYRNDILANIKQFLLDGIAKEKLLLDNVVAHLPQLTSTTAALPFCGQHQPLSVAIQAAVFEQKVENNGVTYVSVQSSISDGASQPLGTEATNYTDLHSPSVPNGNNLDFKGKAYLNSKFEEEDKWTKFSSFFIELLKTVLLICKPKIGVMDFIEKLKSLSFKVVLVTQNLELLQIVLQNHKALFTDKFILTGLEFPFADYIKKNGIRESIVVCETVDFANRMSMEIKSVRFARKYTTVGQNEEMGKNSETLDTLNVSKDLLLEAVDDIDWTDFGIANYTPISYPSRVTPLISPKNELLREVLGWKDTIKLYEPLVVEGKIIVGFGRGSTLLGIPTANVQPSLPLSPFNLPGIYYGFCYISESAIDAAKLESLQMYRMVMSLGYNPYFQNAELSVEPYLFSTFDTSLVGLHIYLVAVGMIRCEANFQKFAHLVQAIQMDCEIAKIATMHK